MEKIVCPGCGAIYHIKSEKPEGVRLRAKCKKCGATFLVEVPGASAEGSGFKTENMPSSSENRYEDKPVLERPIQKRDRDYVAVGVLVVALAAFIFFGYMAFKTILKGEILEPVKTLTDKILNVTFQTSRKYTTRKPLGYKDAIATGHAYFNKKDYKKAVKYYALAERLNPSKPAPLYWQAQALQKLGQSDKAIKKLEKLLNIDPEYAAAYTSLGWIYSKSRKWKKAINYLTKAIQLDSQNGWAYYTRGRCYFKLGKFREALADAKKACDLGFDLGCKVYKKYKK